MNYRETLANLRKERGLTQAEVAEHISRFSGKPHTFKAISHWENGVASPSMEQFILLCELYDVADVRAAFQSPGADAARALLQTRGRVRGRGSAANGRPANAAAHAGGGQTDSVIGGTAGADIAGSANAAAHTGGGQTDSVIGGLAGADARVVKIGAAAALNPLGRSRAAEYVDLLASNPLFAARVALTGKFGDNGRRRSIKLFETPVAAGSGEFLEDDFYEELETDDTVPKDADFALKVSGDSMTPRFVDGQIIFIKKQAYVAPGEIGIFALNGLSYLKKLGRGELLSLNPSYEPIKIKSYDSFHVFGKAVG